jgi:hypothetical protein
VPQITVSKEQLKAMIDSGAFGDKQSPRINIKEALDTGMVTVTYGDDFSPIVVRSSLSSGQSTVQFNLDRLAMFENLTKPKK